MPAHPFVQEMVERVFAAGAGKDASVDGAVAALENANERLEQVLVPVLSDAGYRAILTRSLQKTKAAHPCLEGVATIASEALLEPLFTRLRQQEPSTIRAASIALMIHFVELLSTLIGLELTLKLLRRAWPEHITIAC